MNHPDQPSDTAEREAAQPLIQALDQWQAELDPVQRARLAAARHRALAAGRTPARGYGWLAPGLATGLLLALGISFWPQSPLPQPSMPMPAPDRALAVGEPVLGEEALLDEDAEYLLWLASNDAS